MERRASAIVGILVSLLGQAGWGASDESPPRVVSDYDGGHVFIVRGGQNRPLPGDEHDWRSFNRAMVWLDGRDGLDGAILCCSARPPLSLTGPKAATPWFADKENELAEAGEDVTRFVKKGQAAWDHACTPPFQFAVRQTPVAELEVLEASGTWQFLIVVKGRSGPPIFVSAWRERPERLKIDILDLYRKSKRGYAGNFAEVQFIICLRTASPKDRAAVAFRLKLPGAEAVVPSLPVIRTAGRAAREGVPIHAVVLDPTGTRLGRDAVSVSAVIGRTTVELAEMKDGIWKGTVRDLPTGQAGLPVGPHRAVVRAAWKAQPGKTAEAPLDIRITDGQFIGYDTKLRLLMKAGRPLGPLSGSYRGAPMFRHIGTERESLVHGQAEWKAVQGDRHEGQYGNHGGPDYGFHFWESLTDQELDDDFGHLARSGWSMVHLCQNWWHWERLDAGGRIAPHGAEQLARVIAAAQGHGLHVQFALSHYQNKVRQTRESFHAYLRDFAAVFGDDSGISSLTASGEGDAACGRDFVNDVHDLMRQHAPNHLFLCEPHLNPDPFPADVNSYRREGWKPILGGMRTYRIDGRPFESIAAQIKLGMMGDIFLAEGLFWGFSNGARQMDAYRDRVRCQLYTALACRTPIVLTWEERVVEDERIIFEQVRRLVDWTKPFRRPRLALRVGKDLGVLARYEQALSRIPLEYAFILKDDPVPADAIFTLDTSGPFEPPAFASQGGKLPDVLRADMPLTIPPGFAATYSWSRDGQMLLAFLRDTSGAPGGQGDAKPKQAPDGRDLFTPIGLANFPDAEVNSRVFDLASRNVLCQGWFRQSTTIHVPGSPRFLFLLVGGKG